MPAMRSILAPTPLLLLLQLFLLPYSTGAFKFMQGDWKKKLIPNIAKTMKVREAKEKFGEKKLVVVTGASSTLGRKTCRDLLETGEYYVVGAVRDPERMASIAAEEGFFGNGHDFMALPCKLDSFSSVRQFCSELEDFKGAKPIDRLVCNAATFNNDKDPVWTEDGHEQTTQVNFLSHFLLVSLLMPEMMGAKDPRIILVGAEGGNEKTSLAQAETCVSGGVPGDLKEQAGLRAGFENPIAMLDGYGYDAVKAYKDSKLALMMLPTLLHSKYHRQTGIAFSSIYPGSISGSPLFDGAQPMARYAAHEKAVLNAAITAKDLQHDDQSFIRGSVTAEAAGRRLFQVLHDPRCVKSGVYWSWSTDDEDSSSAAENCEQQQSSYSSWEHIFENDLSDQVTHPEKGASLFRYTNKVVGSSWPKANQVVSPCPTLKVIGAVSKASIKREEMKRMREMPGFSVSDKDHTTRVKLAADAMVGSVVKNTVGRVFGFVLRRMLGAKPEAAIKGSFQEEEELNAELAAKLFKDGSTETKDDLTNDEWTAVESAIGDSLAAEIVDETNGVSFDKSAEFA